MGQDKNNLKNEFNVICERYRKEFIRMYFTYDDGSCPNSWWISDEPGTLLDLDSEYTFSFDTIRYCVDENVKYETLMEWYNYLLKAMDFNLPTPNIKAWCSGCPRTTDDQFKRLSSLRQELDEEIEKIKNQAKGGF